MNILLFEIEEYVIAVMGQVLENRQRPGRVRVAITDKHGPFDAPHIQPSPR